MLFSLARTNFGTSKCQLRGLFQLRLNIVFFYWVAGIASIRLLPCFLQQSTGKSLIINLKCFECRLLRRKNGKKLIKFSDFEDVLNSFCNIAQNQGLFIVLGFVG